MRNGSAVRGRGLSLAIASVVAAVTVLYVSIIVSQGERQVGMVAFVVLLFLTALACVVATRTLDDPAARGVAGSGAAGLLLSMGAVAIFSVGLPLFIAGVLMVVWLVRTRAERRGSGGKLASVAAFIVGAALPWTLLFIH